MDLGHVAVATKGGAFSRLGIDRKSEAIWRSLLRQPTITVAELQTSLGLSTFEIRERIQALIEDQLLRSCDAPCGVQAIDPALAIETHLVREERKMAQQAEDFAAIRAAIPELTRQFSHNRITSDVAPALEVIGPRDDIQRQIDLAAERTTVNIRSCDHLPARYDQSDFDKQFAALVRGVRDRNILPPHSLAIPGVFDSLLKLQERGHDARTHSGVVTRMMIFDRDLAVVPVDNERIELGAVFIRLRSLIDALVMTYDAMWEVSTPIFSSSVDGGGPVGRHARILELLVLGSKDEAIGRSLNIGVRTIRRDVADLKDMLGVSSRTEIAAAAIRRGWL